ncbi:hypothetical protein K470DRAFT_272209 [Piedraia hortae CBS 480.64]|uniref:Uncharacterized protein n=1 Tax=Piedraia hortae CBS 480.64 TaxID=1314780 RepID=A0A6A7BVI3_9PEZI|nr:hypothetical protein K470DRAFT_272209 [Piedraia hortae CBS 480.64]
MQLLISNQPNTKRKREIDGEDLLEETTNWEDRDREKARKNAETATTKRLRKEARDEALLQNEMETAMVPSFAITQGLPQDDLEFGQADSMIQPSGSDPFLFDSNG